MENLIYKNEEPKFSENSIFSWNEEAYFKNLSKYDAQDKLQNLFRETASDLMINMCLVSGTSAYLITECEVYFKDNVITNHIDDNIHGEKQQARFKKFFCNNFGALDITFGFNYLEKEIFGAFLIRGTYKIGSDKSIFNEKERTFENSSTYSFKKLFNNSENEISQGNSIKLRNLSDSFQFEFSKNIIDIPRINLSIENEYYDKPYRYISCICKEHKFDSRPNIIKQLLISGNMQPEEARIILGYNLNYKL